MLSIFLTEDLEREHQIIFYFCSSEDEKRNNAAAALRGLLWQVTARQPELTEHLLQYFDTPVRSQAALTSRETLWTIFAKVVSDQRLTPTLCLLDGLDECDNESTEWLKRSAPNPHPLSARRLGRMRQ